MRELLQGDPALRLRREGIVALAAALAEEGGVGDHRGVVSGVGERDEAEGDAVAVGPGGELAAEEAVGGDSSGDGEEGDRAPFMKTIEAVDELGDRGGAEAGEEIEDGSRDRLSRGSQIDRPQGPFQLFNLQKGLALQSRIGEVQGAAAQGGRKAARGRVTLLRQLVDARPLRIRKTETLADFVEDLSHGVVARLAERLDGAVLDREEGGVATRDDEAGEAVRHGVCRQLLPRRSEKGRIEMAFQMMDGVERALQGEGDRLAEREADEEGSHQAGTARGGHGSDIADIAEADAGRRQRFPAHPRPVGEVLPRRDLRDHAAVGTVRGELAGDHGREHPPLAVEHRAGGVVARGLDPENEGGVMRDARRLSRWSSHLRGRLAARRRPGPTGC